MRRIIINLFLIGLLMQANFVLADIFLDKDENGAVSYSDKPSSTATKIETSTKQYRYKYKVKRVYDGDTITLQNGFRVRLLGINTPEIKSRHQQGESGGKQATMWLKNKLHKGSVFLEYDVLKKDKYKRHLAHLFLDDGEHLNKSLLEEGLATLSIIPPNLRHSKRLEKAEAIAKVNKRGIWGNEAYRPIQVEKLLEDEDISGWNRFLTMPKKITESRKYKRLVLGEQLDIRIAKKNLHYFPDLEEYMGQQLEVRGWASRKKTHFSILVRHPSAITILQ